MAIVMLLLLAALVIFILLSYRDAEWNEVVSVTVITIALLSYVFSIFVEHILLLLILWVSVVGGILVVWEERLYSKREVREIILRSVVGLSALVIVVLLVRAFGVTEHSVVWLLIRFWPLAFIANIFRPSREIELPGEETRWSTSLSLAKIGFFFLVANGIFFFTGPAVEYIVDLLMEMTPSGVE